MQLRRFALSFAAAGLLVSFAHAEDAVVPNEWEQQEAVGACDVYGAGYARIPGTNTCARVSGAVRYDKHFGDDPTRSRSGTYLDFETRSD